MCTNIYTWFLLVENVFLHNTICSLLKLRNIMFLILYRERLIRKRDCIPSPIIQTSKLGTLKPERMYMLLLTACFLLVTCLPIL
jgi:hypothetical protein